MKLIFEDNTKENVLRQIDNFNLQNNTEVEKIIIKEEKGLIKATVKFKLKG